jgi:hypothetical protein
MKTNPDYMVGNFTISKNSKGIPTVNINVNITKTLNIKIMVKTWRQTFGCDTPLFPTTPQLKIRVFGVHGKIRRTLLPFPSINYCDVMSGHFIPMVTLQVMLAELKRFGNLVGPCPIVPGLYNMKDYTMDETASSFTKMLAEGSRYLSNYTLTDENFGRPVNIASFQILFTCNHSNWKG